MILIFVYFLYVSKFLTLSENKKQNVGNIINNHKNILNIEINAYISQLENDH